MNDVYKVDSLLSDEYFGYISKIIFNMSEEELILDSNLGRVYKNLNLPEDITRYLEKLVGDLFDIENPVLSSTLYVEYNSKYGPPNLPPHFDGDDNDITIDFQFSSNTRWDLGVNLDLYEIKNNSAVIFNPNTNIHWRPIKNFNSNEYVKMIFFRFFDSVNRSDYSYARYSQDHPVFKDVCSMRNSLALD